MQKSSNAIDQLSLQSWVCSTFGHPLPNNTMQIEQEGFVVQWLVLPCRFLAPTFLFPCFFIVDFVYLVSCSPCGNLFNAEGYLGTSIGRTCFFLRFFLPLHPRGFFFSLVTLPLSRKFPSSLVVASYSRLSNGGQGLFVSEK